MSTGVGSVSAYRGVHVWQAETLNADMPAKAQPPFLWDWLPTGAPHHLALPVKDGPGLYNYHGRARPWSAPDYTRAVRRLPEVMAEMDEAFQNVT